MSDYIHRSPEFQRRWEEAEREQDEAFRVRDTVRWQEATRAMQAMLQDEAK